MATSDNNMELQGILIRTAHLHRRSQGGAVGAPAPSQGGEKKFSGLIYRKNV